VPTKAGCKDAQVLMQLDQPDIDTLTKQIWFSSEKRIDVASRIFFYRVTLMNLSLYIVAFILIHLFQETEASLSASMHTQTCLWFY